MITREIQLGADIARAVETSKEISSAIDGEVVRFKFNGVWVLVDYNSDVNETVKVYHENLKKPYRAESNVEEKTIYSIRGRTFDTKEEAEKYNQKVSLIEALDDKINIRYIEEWEVLMGRLEEEGYSITQTGEII